MIEKRERINWDEYFLNIAKDIALRGTCKRRVYGAVIVDKNNKIVSTGYCGSPSRVTNCSDLEQQCYRQLKNIPSGTRYDECWSVHAEMNAIIQGDPLKLKDAKMYIIGLLANDFNKEVEGKPCRLCQKTIINAGIDKIITRKEGKIIEYPVSQFIRDMNNQIKEAYNPID